MKNKIIVISGILLILSIGLTGCMDSASDIGGGISESVNPPKFIITSKTSREGYEGADRVGYVDVSISNNGGSGSRTVYCKVVQGSDEWTKSKSVNLKHDETTDISFRFDEIKFWTLDPWSYSAWIES